MKPLLLRKVLLALLVCGAALIVPACSRNDAAPQAVQGAAKAAPAALPAAASHWYFFSTGTDGSVRLQGTETITSVPPVGFRPWTEAVRIADSSLNGDTFFLINKCGIYPLNMLQPDVPLRVQHPQFVDATAADIYTVGGDIFMRLYQDSAFLPPEKITNTSFLLKYNAATASCSPVADIRALHLPEQAQCKSLAEVEGQWYASFKADNGTDIAFTYLMCKDFSVFTHPDAHQRCEQISAEAFRAACEPRSYTAMPELVKSLVASLNNAADLYIRLCSDTGVQGDVFFKPAHGKAAQSVSAQQPLNAYAIVYTGTQKQQSAALLLPDGTFLTCTEKQEMKELHLPALPEHFSYTAFLISGANITAAWEESVFYGVGRTGFFTAAVSELSR